MPLSSAFHKLLRSLLCCVFLLSAVFLPSQANAIYEGVRSDTVYRDNHMCNGSKLKFDPFTENKDLTWELTNPLCAGFISGIGASLLATGYVIDGVGYGKFKTPGTCTPTSDFGKPKKEGEASAARFSPTTPALLTTSKSALYRISAMCGSRSAELATATAALGPACSGAGAATPTCQVYIPSQIVAASSDTTKCCNSYLSYLAIFTSAVATLTLIWDKANITYENARLCGHDWNQWVQENGTHVKKAGPYQICLKQAFAGNNIIDANCALTLGVSSSELENVGKPADASNKFYREFIYGGKEFADVGDSSCINPWGSDKSLRKKYLGYTDDNQRYYMTGAGGGASTFACHRFLSGGANKDTQKAYECCRRRSQTSVCIQNKTGLGGTLGNYETKFCEIGSICDVADTKFEVYASVKNPNYACVKTYSVCPYNHLLGGGTEEKEIEKDISKGARVKNYCQYMNHCTKLPIMPYVYSSNLSGAYISSACRDLKGDSQNKYGYTDQLVPINTRNFSAPMAQCFKETIENVFLNKAGATKCENPEETPDANGICVDGYFYRKGDPLSQDSVFANIQEKLKAAIQIGLVISVMAFGYSILMGVPKVDTFNKKALLSYIVKIAIVMYFAVGTGWQSGFMNGVLGFSGFMSELVFKPDAKENQEDLDGCQFPRFNYADSNEETRYENPAYPKGMEYLRIWDTLDCKIARALGYGPEVSVPNLIFMILGGFLDYGGGIVFVVASLFLAFVMIMITVRALHIFLMSTTAVILLLYVSPITITCAMFNRTKGIFSGWWKQILGLSLQPMILFAYLGVFIALFDMVIVGDVKFRGDGKKAPKQIICDNSSVADVLFVDPFSKGKINENGNSTSIYCIFRVATIDTFHGLEVLGIGLPVLASMTKEKLATITKAALLMFIFLQFLDKISKFAVNLVGGAELQSDIAGAGKMASRMMSGMQAIQKRGKGALTKLAAGAMRGGISNAKSLANALGNKGKKGAPSGGGASNDLNPADRSDSSKSGDKNKNSKISEDSNSSKKENPSAKSDKAKFKPNLETIPEEGEGAAGESKRPDGPEIITNPEVKTGGAAATPEASDDKTATEEGSATKPEADAATPETSGGEPITNNPEAGEDSSGKDPEGKTGDAAATPETSGVEPITNNPEAGEGSSGKDPEGKTGDAAVTPEASDDKTATEEGSATKPEAGAVTPETSGGVSDTAPPPPPPPPPPPTPPQANELSSETPPPPPPAASSGDGSVKSAATKKTRKGSGSSVGSSSSSASSNSSRRSVADASTASSRSNQRAKHDSGKKQVFQAGGHVKDLGRVQPAASNAKGSGDSSSKPSSPKAASTPKSGSSSAPSTPRESSTPKLESKSAPSTPRGSRDSKAAASKPELPKKKK